MSRRSSAGDLVPRDISQILAREGKAQRGQKKAGGSLGQALGWLRGTKRKKRASNEPNQTGSGATEGDGTKHGHQIQDSPKAGPKAQDDQRRLVVHYRASSQYQENVFVEGRRPQHIEDLHTEALQGLKILQQEEHGKRVDLQDNQGNAGLQQDACTQEREGPLESRNSAGSTFRPLNPVKRQEKGKKRIRRTTIMGLPQQIHRELALHKESAYEVPSRLTNASDGHSSDDQADIVVIPTIDGETSTNQDGARVHLSNLEASRDEQLLRRHLQNIYRDDQGFPHHRGLNSHMSPTQRPKSLAVPGMTSSAGIPSYLQEPQGPVMSISPQATYLSKIIPNAYLPASVEVIQISRSTSRGHGNNSKSSITSGSSASPASSRTSGGNGCCDDGDCVSHGGSSSHDDGSTAAPHSAFSGSGWSHSQSSETIKSNSSTISSTKGSFGPANPQTVSITGQERQPQRPDTGDKHLVCSKGSIIATGQGRSESGLSGSLSAGDTSDVGGVDSQRFSRSLSIMKTKMPPAPPRRTNSLHHENLMKRRPQELLAIRDLRHSVGKDVEAGKDTGQMTIEISKELYKQITKSSVPESNSSEDTRSSTISSPLGPMQDSLGGGKTSQRPESNSTSPQKAPSEGGKFDRTMSPSSGYSSQSGTPTLSPKEIGPSASTGKQKKPAKPERSGSRASASSSLTSLSSVTSEHVNKDTLKKHPSPPQQPSPPLAAMKSKTLARGTQAQSPISMEIKNLLNIPPPPNVKAPSPPPPETWAQNRRTFELLCPPRSHSINSLAQLQKQQELKETTQMEQQQEAQNKDSKESQGLMGKQDMIAEVFLMTSESKENSLKKTKPTLDQVPDIHKCLTKAPGTQVLIPEKEASVAVQKQTCNVSEDQDQEVKQKTQSEICLAINRKKDPPPVMKKNTPRPHRKDPEIQTAAAACQQKVVLTTESEMFLLQTDADVVKQDAVVAKEAKVVTKQVEFEVVAKEVKAVTKQVEVEVVAKKVEVVSKQVEVGAVAEEVEGQCAVKNTTECPNNPEPSMQTLGSMVLPKVDKVSPPASPPPAHHPPPPPSKTPPSFVSTLLPDIVQGVVEEVLVVESNWPPPPPPEEPSDSVFDEPDEMAFPPPPPPFIIDSHKVESCNTSVDAHKTSIVALGVCEDKRTLNRATVNEETASLLPTLTQVDIKEDRPEKAVVYSNPNADSTDDISSGDLTVVLSNEKDPVVNQLSSMPINLEELSTESKETYPESQVKPPPSHKTSLPHKTTALGAPSNVPHPPSINTPLTHPVQFEDQTALESPVSGPSVNDPLPPPLPAENQPAVTFRRQPSFVNRETKARSKELLSRHKSTPIPKEDANIPLVTPSLLQMVRLRSVHVGEDQMKAPSSNNNNDENTPAFYQGTSPTQTLGSQNTTPQKPVRKSLSMKSTSLRSSPATLVAPSMRLQEAIRMKTAAMSSRDGLPTRFKMPPSITFPSSSGGDSGKLSPTSLEGGDMLKSPASTASFIFSKSSKKIVIETPVSSSEVQVSLHQSLAEELKLVSNQSKTSTVANGNIGRAGILKRVPPPVAKKPTHGITNPSERPVCFTVKNGNVQSQWRREANGGIETVQPAGQQAQPEDHNTGSTMDTSSIPEAPLPL